MKNDCPHCHKSMTGRFMQWSKLAQTDRARNCPLCGGNIEYRIHPEEIAARKTVEQRFHPPLDIVDGAARILDPIIHGLNTGEHVWGQFLKDFRPADW